ncbi:MAG: quinolinate synthase NadA [Solirubrobacteraceae bacterium]
MIDLPMAAGQVTAPPNLSLEEIRALPRPAKLTEQEIEELKLEIRALAAEREAVVLAHNYELPEVQDVADYVGDSLGLSRRAAAAPGKMIVFCGVHFMAETASVLCPSKTVLLPDPLAGCSLASSIDAEQLAQWKASHPGAIVVMYVNTSAAVKALTDYCCTSANAVQVVQHVYGTHGEDSEILFGPDLWLGAYVERELGKPMRVWDGECNVHAGIRQADLEAVRAAHPSAELLIHPECGCSTSMMEYVAAGDVSPRGVHMLSTGGMLRHASEAERDIDQAPAGPSEMVVATEVGMLYGLGRAAPNVSFIPANPDATCAFMKMITLPKVRDALLEGRYEVKVPEDIAVRARVPIERMVAIG